MLCFLAPMSFLEKLNSLRFVRYAISLASALIMLSAAAILSVAYLVCIVIVCYFLDIGIVRKPIQMFTVTGETLSAIPIFVFAFTCHQNVRQ